MPFPTAQQVNLPAYSLHCPLRRKFQYLHIFILTLFRYNSLQLTRTGDSITNKVFGASAGETADVVEANCVGAAVV